jgi:type II secretory ATPase GspE/PulE/Tfp pilus assembly ATPase PilB-like protein
MPQPKTPDFFGYRTAYDIITDAKWRRASIVSFAPTAQGYEVTYYVDGALLKQPAIPKEQMEYFIRFVKQLGNLDINEKRKPQKGKFRTRQNKENTDWEVTTAGSTVGEQVKLKQITKESVIRLVDLGLVSDQYEQISKFRELHEGLFVVSGPEKSGVTTTLYALLRNHDAFINSINTLEKQPSGVLQNVTQNTYTLTDTGTTTYAQRLTTMIRMGSDIVGVGECEDAETAQAAAAAAKDGKIVYVALKADSVLQALGRWMKLVGDRKLVVATVLGVSNQRLLRKLCDQCKQAYTPNTDLLKKFNLPADKAKVLYRPGKEIYDKKGKPMTCPSCQGTGFVGRTAIFEMIAMDDELRKVIRHAKALPEIGLEFRRAKMLYLQEQALRRVIAGTTAINEMLRVLSLAKKTEG